MKKLHLGNDCSLPLEAVTETFLDLGQRGSGKTNSAAVIAEELYTHGAPFCVLTPIDVWWGLKSSFDGRGPGLPIYIFGGRHGDLPLVPTSGKLMADVLVEQRISCVICTQGFSGKERAQFVTDFAERLLDKNREPLHLIVEEADAFIPQKPFPGEERMLGAMDRLIRWGRSSAMGGTFISQRSAKINKDITTQCSVLLAHRTAGPQDIDAIKEWFKYHQDPKVQQELLSGISSLPKGTCFLYSPAWLECFRKVQVRRRNTFDSAATPKLGDKKIAPRTAVVDLKVLESKMAETIQRVKADDPQELKREISRLTSELKKANTFQSTMKPEVKEVEKSILTDEDREKLSQLSVSIRDVEASLSATRHMIEGSMKWSQFREAPRPPTPVPPSTQRTPRVVTSAPQGADLGKCERAILQVLSQFDDGCEVGKLTLLTRYRYSGGFKNSLSALRQQGLIVGGNTETMRITELGLAQGPFDPMPQGKDLLNWWLSHNSFGVCERKILQELVSHPRGLTADQLCEHSGYQYSGGFKNSLSNLRTAGVLIGRNTEVMRAAEDLL